MKSFADAAQWAKDHGEATPMSHWETPGIPQLVEDFITKTEARVKTAG